MLTRIYLHKYAAGLVSWSHLSQHPEHESICLLRLTLTGRLKFKKITSIIVHVQYINRPYIHEMEVACPQYRPVALNPLWWTVYNFPRLLIPVWPLVVLVLYYPKNKTSPFGRPSCWLCGLQRTYTPCCSWTVPTDYNTPTHWATWELYVGDRLQVQKCAWVHW